VRELQSVIKQSILHAVGPVLVLEFLPATSWGATGPAPAGLRAEGTDVPDLARFIDEGIRAGVEGLHAEFLAATERQLMLQVRLHRE
jgi:hypothetical protein